MKIVKIGRFWAKLRTFENRGKGPKVIKILRITLIREKSLIFGHFSQFSNARNFAYRTQRF